MSEINMEKLAQLAHLRLSEPEQVAALADLEAIVGMIDTFNAADVGATAPMSHPLDLHARLRADAATAQIDRDRYQALAPSAEGGHYLVPKVIDRASSDTP